MSHPSLHLSRVSKPKKKNDERPDSKRVTNRNKRCATYPIPIVRSKICSTKKKVHQAEPARKHRVLHNPPSNQAVRFEIASACITTGPLYRDPQPQYSLNRNFLPISRRRALTVALSEGFVAPSSRDSPLAFNAWRSMPASKKPSVS